jgi:2-amino-4-hydroxy-6-hydroxymethyldihydropteridine diphosphokinase
MYDRAGKFPRGPAQYLSQRQQGASREAAVKLIGLGANLDSPAGPPPITLTRALSSLAQRGISIVRVSGFYRTPAWPDPADPSFVNAVALVDTSLEPAALLQVLHEVEAEFGRSRTIPNAPRTLDLDLLDYDGRVEAGAPILPHPRLEARAFVLVPLADVAPAWRHPQAGKGVAEMLDAIPVAERKKVVRLSP